MSKLCKMLTIKEAASITGLSTYMIRTMFLNGTVAGYKNGGTIFINEDSLAERLSSNMNTPRNSD